MLRKDKITDAHRSPASLTSPLKVQNRVVMLRGAERGAAARFAIPVKLDVITKEAY